MPQPLRSALTIDDLRALDQPANAVRIVEDWRSEAESSGRSAAQIEAELDELADAALAARREDIKEAGRMTRADANLLHAVSGLDLPSLSRRMRATAASAPDLAGSRPPHGIDPDTWLAFLRHALPVFEQSPQQCPLCRSDIVDRHAGLVRSYRALLADQRAVTARDAEASSTAVRDALLAHGGATERAEYPLRELVSRIADALDVRDADELDGALAGIDALATAVRTRLDDAHEDWRRSIALLRDAEDRRTALRHELAVARRAEAIDAYSEAVDDLLDQLRRRERLAAAAKPLGTKQRINTALRKHTDDVLKTPYGDALGNRLKLFKVPHVDKLTARHHAKGGLATRHHLIGKRSTDVLFSEGEQRALALADFAAELDTRTPAKHPVVIDDPVSSLDYRRLEHVVDYVRELRKQDRQVVVLTHSLWLAAALLKLVDKQDHAWMLVRDDHRLGTTAPINKQVLGEVGGLENRIEKVISNAEREPDPATQHELITHGLGLIRAWCESFVEQKTLCQAISRLDWQVRPRRLRDITRTQLERGLAVAALYDKLHERIAAHGQPGELLHRPDALDDLRELWDEANAGLFDRPDEIVDVHLADLEGYPAGSKDLLRQRAQHNILAADSPAVRQDHGAAGDSCYGDSVAAHLVRTLFRPIPGTSGAAVLRGHPASPGVARGPVRRVRLQADIGSVRPGEVLVTPDSASGWSFALLAAAAVVAETGHPFGHLAALARDYNRPAVVAVGDSRERLQDGESVEVDGLAGTVRRVRDPTEDPR